MSEWINCSDRLPLYNQNVLVCFETVLGTMQTTTAQLNHQKRCADPESVDYDNIWYVTVGWGHNVKPTHWQPIPALPGEDREEGKSYFFETGAYEVELGREKWAAIHSIFENYNASELPNEEFTCSEGDVNGLVSEILIALDLARAE